MGQPVDANGRSILHKGHGMTHACAVPDVCKTPTPAGPVPLPYPNFAMDSNLVDGAESVQIEGNPVTTVASKIATSTGDEPGSVGGIMSNVVKGTCTWKMGSLDVKAEGNSVVRFLDTSFHNGNSFNSSFINQGGTGLGYAGDFEGPCPICGKPAVEHEVPHNLENSAALCTDIIRRLREYNPRAHVDPRRNGYMVGAMVCDCGQKWAAKSGAELPGFDEVAQAAGATPITPGGPATVGQMILANNSGIPNAAGQILGRWLHIEISMEVREGGYVNRPGNCAGAKLLANGHKPLSMTEMWFRRTDRDPEHLIGPYRQYEVTPGGLTVQVMDEAFPESGAIGSCNTCQDLIFMTMCPEKNCP